MVPLPEALKYVELNWVLFCYHISDVLNYCVDRINEKKCAVQLCIELHVFHNALRTQL